MTRYAHRLILAATAAAACLAFAGNAGPASATEPSRAAEAFVTAPTTVFPAIDSLTRLDMVDYFRSGSDRASKNLFNGQARVTHLTPDQITVETSAAAEKTITIIPRGNGRDSLLMVITTVKTPAEDSTVKFYTTSWQPVDKGLFIVPALDDWMQPQAADKRQDVENAVPFMLAKISYEPAMATLTLVNNLGAYLPEETSTLAGNALKSELSYRWDGHKMVRIK